MMPQKSNFVKREASSAGIQFITDDFGLGVIGDSLKRFFKQQRLRLLADDDKFDASHYTLVAYGRNICQEVSVPFSQILLNSAFIMGGGIVEKAVDECNREGDIPNPA